MGIALGLPLLLIGLLEWEREDRARGARDEMALRAGQAQTFSGPFLVVPRVQETVRRETRSDGTVSESPVVRRTWLYVSPRTLDIDVDQTTHRLRRAIYEVPAQASVMKIRATFGDLPKTETEAGRIDWSAARWALGFSDLRGLGRVDLGADGRALDMKVAEVGGGLQLAADASGLVPDKPVTLAGTVELKGVASLHFTPGGQQTQVSMRSDWPHPSFGGAHLPAERAVDAEGFEARWVVSSFARGIPAVAQDGLPIHGHAFGVVLVDPTDGYAQVGRSLKYGLLFVLLTLGGFLVLELVSGMRVHPAQYGLLGLAQVSFYLLLLALSEHVSIEMAYGAAGLVTTFLSGAYALWTFGHRRFAGVVLAGVGISYGFQYTLVRLEDHALLLGSGLVFIALALVMHATRRVRWYDYSAAS